VLAIQKTLYQYAHGIDYGPEEAFVDVFAEDGKWIRVEGRLPERRFEGRSAFVKMYQHHTHFPETIHKHAVLNPYIEVDGDSATARSYLILVWEDPETPYVRAFSRCFDRLVRCADGKWRILERRAELESWANRDTPPPPWHDLPLIVSS
jgi:ketosteroid isomerase-like protein